jgi:hydroxypyruvate reductase
MRKDAQAIFHHALLAADAERAVARFVKLDSRGLAFAGELLLSLDDFDRILVAGAGKASAAMAKSLEAILGERIHSGLVCVKYGHAVPLKRIRVIEAGHPLPDAAGEQAAREIIALLESAGENDLILCCISGGGSALLPAAAPPVTLEAKIRLTSQLLSVAADIHEINAVRKHLSLTKGGNLMRAAHPAFVVNLMLSDVIGDYPDVIASGPFVADRSTFADAWAVLERYGLREIVDKEVRDRIEAGLQGRARETPKDGDEMFTRVRNFTIGSNIISLRAAAAKAEDLGYQPLILSSTIRGDTTQAALFHASIAEEVRSTGNPVRPPACILSGGETTVTIKGGGLGGRNQEFCLALVEKASRLGDIVFLSAGTDGTDGPTDAAGALVDCRSMERSRGLGLDPAKHLAHNDSHGFFKALDDLIVTGPTLTNVMDLRLILMR